VSSAADYMQITSNAEFNDLMAISSSIIISIYLLVGRSLCKYVHSDM